MTSDKQNNYPPARLAWSMWGLGAALYLIDFYQRVAPAVMTGELMIKVLLRYGKNPIKTLA